MNIRKNFEALFLAAAALGLVASYATARERPVEMVETSFPALSNSYVQTIVISAPRLSAAEKAAQG
jgi:hypothetical protein